ncbi:TIGR04282 family arsenosugar biosynthesis glycosyltransferase [Shimia gijangensis]|nr:TIGR04282 family arsenosugar biosynthesis glycosyltransferase [Shimia gijangensis]
MIKEPHAGRVKTRLGRDIGMTAAAWWFRHQSASLLRRITDPRWETFLAITPDKQGLTSRIWPENLPRIAQGSGNLGQRMARVFTQLPPGPALIIGADIPGIRTTHITRAFRKLGAHDAVFGPATDGGFWLVGLKRTFAPPVTLFENVRWSTPHALNDTVRTMPDLRIAFTDVLADVDTARDL